MLKSLDEDKALTRAKCFEVGWLLLSPDNWTYINIWTRQRGVVTVEALNEAIKEREKRYSI